MIFFFKEEKIKEVYRYGNNLDKMKLKKNVVKAGKEETPACWEYQESALSRLMSMFQRKGRSMSFQLNNQ